MKMEDDTCRLCGIKLDIEYSKYIFDEVTNLAQIINETLPIKVSQDDHSKSKHICLDCYDKVISHYEFIQNVSAFSKESKTKINSFFEVNRNEKLENVVISKLQSDMICTCPNCNKDLILLLKNNSEDSNYAFDISLAVVDQIVEKVESVEENSQIFEDTMELVNVSTQKSSTESKLHELSLNHDIVEEDVTNDNKQDINGINRSSKSDTNLNITLQKIDVLCEPSKGTKRKYQEGVSTETSITSTKLQKLQARLDAMKQDVDELNGDHDRLNVTGLTFQSVNNGVVCLNEEIENEEENSTEYTMRGKHFDENLTKSETLKTKLDATEQDELTSDYDRSSLAGLITFQPESNDTECFSCDVETQEDDSTTDVTKTEKECTNEDEANDIDIPKNLKHVCNLCGIRYNSQLKYKFHMDRHKFNKIDKYVCLICSKETKNENLLWEHYIHMHKNPERYTCLNCNRTFTTKPNLDEHQKKYRHVGYRQLVVNVETDEDNNQTQKVTKQKRKCTVCRKLIRDTDPNAINDPAMCATCEDASAYLIVDGEAAKVISQRRYHCLKCRKHFMRQDRLEFHEMRHNENTNEFICSTCGKDFSGENALYEHYIFVHKGIRPHVCEICGKSFQLKTRLREHLRKHTGEKPYQCERCGLRCMTTHALKFHMKSHVLTRHTCEICSKAFIKKQNLNEHLEKHWKKDKNIALSRIFTCPVCSCELPTFRMLKHHVIATHQLDRQDPLVMKQKPLYECNECQEKFKHQMSLKAHKEKVHEGKTVPRVFQCDLCKAVYKVKQMLINHIKSKHEEKQYKCAKCNTIFADMKTLYRHVSLYHNTKRFTRNVNFRRRDTGDAQRREHTNNRPYQCTDCNKSFGSYTGRSNHRRKIHGDNQTKCLECGQKYGDLQIRIHLNDHLGAQLRQCKLEST